ncbi:hypothetical protein DPMN_166306 [Dreissena polymorpha]|uniref:Uncharacterized protein n=1 Tax=Dreissena polymorpha TaxID=45954 RepID=A0A9D4EZ86_DREPO|nr:hypothetical protein DPMN_166306 [Dreissena polymorpha]
MYRLAQKRARRRRQRRWWIRAWLGPERRRQFGLYDQLMVELRREDQRASINIMRMPPIRLVLLMANILPSNVHQDPGLRILTTRSTSPLSCWLQVCLGGSDAAQLWNESDLKAAAENGDIDLPETEALPHDIEDVPYFFIGKKI